MLPKRTKKIQLVICHTQVLPDIRWQDFWLANCKFGYGRHRIAKSAPYPPSAGAQKASLCPGRLVFKCETIVGWHPHFLSCLLLGITLATGSVWALKDHPEFKELTVHKSQKNCLKILVISLIINMYELSFHKSPYLPHGCFLGLTPTLAPSEISV